MLLIEDAVDQIPAGIPGVYLLHLYDAGSGAYPALYAGKASDLRFRLFQHLRSMSTTPEFVIARHRISLLRYSAAPVLDVQTRNGIEAGLILRLRPPFNRQVPRAVPVFTSLPPMANTKLEEEDQ